MTWFDMYNRFVRNISQSKMITLDKKILDRAGIKAGDKVDIKIKKVP